MFMNFLDVRSLYAAFTEQPYRSRSSEIQCRFSGTSLYICQLARHHLNLKQLTNCAVPWLGRLVAGISSWKPGFSPGSAQTELVLEQMALGQVFLAVGIVVK